MWENGLPIEYRCLGDYQHACVVHYYDLTCYIVICKCRLTESDSDTAARIERGEMTPNIPPDVPSTSHQHESQ